MTRSVDFDRRVEDERRANINSLLAIAVASVMFLLGLNARNGAINATVEFEDPINGISAQVPANWLLDRTNADYVLRAQDLGTGTFNPLIQISVQVVGDNASPRNVVDQRNLQLSAELNDYNTLQIAESQLGEDPTTQITYTFVSSESNPFLQSIPTVVQGIDVVVIRENQAIIFTFRDEHSAYDRNFRTFERFLDSVEY